MAWLSPVIGMIGSIATAYGANRTANAQAGAATYNAHTAEQNAAAAEQQGAAAVEALRRDQARSIGRMKALYGASGVQVDTGSPMDVLADSARSAELDVLTTQYNYQMKAAGYAREAGLDYANADNARKAGVINSTSALLRGASSFFNNSGSVPSFGT